MGQAGRHLRRFNDSEGWFGQGFAHWCPACETMHGFAVERPFRNGAKWTFDGNLDRPTFTPSMNIKINTPDMGKDYQPDVSSSVCHYFLKEGNLQFLGDCTHAMKGQTVPLPELPMHLRDESSGPCA